MLGDLEKKQILVNIQTYGDFDIPSTDAILIAPRGYDRGDVSKLVQRLSNEHSKTDNTDGVIKKLKSLGFKFLTTIDLTIGGDL